ncbi:TPA: glycosyltransferase [Vibrio vulnificus]|nr:glycosyltransferase [Vibrio vulnificus]
MVNEKIVSIVVINFNNEYGLRQTLKTVVRSKSSLVEIIVVDGLSSDNSMDVVHNFHDDIDVIISEKDEGIYDAMNKGVSASSGNSIIFINSGDYIADDFDFNNFVIDNFELFKDTIIYGGNFIKINDRIFRKNPYQYSKSKKILPSHQSIFVPKDYLVDNPFPVDMKVSSDSYVLLKAFDDLPSLKVDEYISVFELGGVSNNWPNFKALLSHCKEYSTVRDKIFINVFVIFFVKFIFIKFLGYERYYTITFSLREYFSDFRINNNKK